MAISTIDQKGLSAPLSLTSPVLTTPNLGTPSAINLSNATALPASAMPTGSIIQVVNAPFTNYTNTNSTSFIDVTGATASITPQFTASRILLLINLVGITKNTGADTTAAFQLLRNGSSVFLWDGFVGYTGNTGIWTGQSATTWVDSPATTSAITYKVQWKTSGGTFQINNYNISPSYSTSTITLMEIR